MSSETTANTNQETQIEAAAIEVDDEEKKVDLNRAPSILKRRSRLINMRSTISIDDPWRSTTLLNINEAKLNEIDEPEEIFEYGFGVPFSYWPEYTHYPYIAANHKSLKDELLNNNHYSIKMDEWDQVTTKAQTNHQNIQNILGVGSDKNTPYAHYNEQFNEIFKIKHKQLISIP
eukprot:168409_1